MARMFLHHITGAARSLALLLLVGGLLAACEDTASMPQRRPASANAQPPVEEPPTDEFVQEDYQRPEYPGRRRNPFEPSPDLLLPAQVVTNNEVRPVEPLEQFPISSLKLVAIISETAVAKAMFVDPDGFGHFVKEGDRIGPNEGVIARIGDNGVEIRERDGGDAGAATTVVVKLRDVEINSGDDETLSAEERQALERLMSSDSGREALQRATQQNAAGAAPSAPPAGASPPPDGRFSGIAPPSGR